MDKENIEKIFQKKEFLEYYDGFNFSLPIALIHKFIFNESENILKTRYNLMHSDIDVLANLYFNERELSPTELYAATVFSSGGMTKVLKKLEILGYITRVKNPEDKRSSLVKLNDLGEKIVLQCLDEIHKERTPICDVLTKDEKEFFKKILKKIVLNLP